MALVSLANLTNGTLADANAVMGNYNAIVAQVNGHLDNSNLDPALLAQIGASDPANVRSGWAIMAGTDTRTNAAYGLMTVPDRITGVVLPNGGHIEVFYQAAWQEAVSGQARAAIFVGANQLKVASQNVGTVIQEAGTGGGNTGADAALSSFALGLQSGVTPGVYAEATTPQAIGVTSSTWFYGPTAASSQGDGGACRIFAPPGTYDVSVQFKAAGGVTVKTRRLYVKAIAF